MDLAEIGLKADSRDILKADDALDDFAASAKGAENAANKFTGAQDKADKSSSRFSRTLDKIRQPLGFLATTLATIGVGLGLSSIIQASDQYTSFTNSLRVAGLEGENLATVQDRLFESANRNGAQINALGTLYSRANLASETLGASQEQLLQFTDGVTASLRVAGTSASSASGALLQLSQALGGGIVRAEEFNSILEGAPTIVQAVADGLEAAGGSVSRLRNLVLEGEVSSKAFFDAFLIGSQSMIDQAQNMDLTIGAAFTTLSNGFLRLVGVFTETTGLSSGLAMGIQAVGYALNGLAVALPTIIDLVQPLAPLFLATFGPIFLGQILSLATAVGVTLYGAFSSLFLLLAANPLTAVVGSIVLVLSYMVDWEKSIHALINAWAIFVANWQLFWGNEAGAKRTIEIAINAKEAVSDLMSAGEQIRATVEEGFNIGTNSAAPQLTRALDQGGAVAAGHIKNSMTVTADQAKGIWEELNGRVVKPLGQTLVEGGDYIHNQTTGAVEKVGQKIEEGGTTAGDTIGQKMVSAGEQAGATIYSSVESAFASLAPLEDVFRAFWYNLRAEVSLMHSQAQKTVAEARLAMAEAAEIRAGRDRRSSGGSGGSSSGRGSNVTYGNLSSDYRGGNSVVNSAWAGGFAQGGSFVVGGTGGPDSQRVSMDLTPGERVSVTKPGKESVVVKNINILDPAMIPAAMATAEGEQVILNMFTARREEFKARLGGY